MLSGLWLAGEWSEGEIETEEEKSEIVNVKDARGGGGDGRVGKGEK